MACCQRVCKPFLEQLRYWIGKAPELQKFDHDMHVGCRYEGNPKKNSCSVWLYRKCWTPYQDQGGRPESGERTIIELCAPQEGPNGWFIAVSSPIKKSKIAIDDKKRRDRLDKELQVRLPPGCAPQKLHPPSGGTWDEVVFMVVPVQDRPGDHFPTVFNSMSSVL